MGTIQVTPGESGRLIVRFSYSTERVAVIRAVPGRRWHPEEKCWTVPHTPETLDRMRSLFTSDRVIVAAAVEASSEELPVVQMTDEIYMHDELIIVNPPLYLASTIIACWRCGAGMPVVALIAPNVPEAEGEICTLSDVKELPSEVLSFIQKRFPSFKLKYSKTIQSEYYANTCPECGVLSGDFYLHSEPGAPFFPTTENEAKDLVIETVSINPPIYVRASLGMGGGDLILGNVNRLSAEASISSDAQKDARG
jgi:hypothetical protein